jgi:hypothetical protein
MLRLTRDAYRGPVLRRMHLMEFHDQAWFPSSCRDAVTDTLESILGLENLYAPIVPHLGRALQKAKTHEIVDLCSGAGGPWKRILPVFEKQENSAVSIWLTDKYPNLVALSHTSNASQNKIGFHSDPVDATHIPAELRGFRIFFNSFHHFQPSEARALLQNAVDSQQGVGIFELPGRNLLTVLLVFLVPILAFAVVPFIRPFRLWRLIWTYLIPVNPVVLFLDGILSCLRAYSLVELSDLTRGLSASIYTWEIGEERTRFTNVPVTYLAVKRSGAWVECRANGGQELVIGGYIPGPHGFDSLIVGYYQGKDLIYVARVRNGFVPASRRQAEPARAC